MGTRTLWRVNKTWLAWLAGDGDAALAPGLAVGITVAAGLAFGWRRVSGYLPLASAVALVLLLAPDAYAALGLIFLVGVLGHVPSTRFVPAALLRPPPRPGVIPAVPCTRRPGAGCRTCSCSPRGTRWMRMWS